MNHRSSESANLQGNQVLRRVAAWMDGFSKRPPSERLSYRVYTWSLPKSLSHMRTAGPRFYMSPPDATTDERELFWDRRLVGATRSPAELKNSRSGHCFLVATGPSLSEVDLKLLAGHPTFGVNGAIARFKEAGLSPTYYTIGDDDFFENRFPMVRDVLASGCKCFFTFQGLSRICEFAPASLREAEVYLMEYVNRHYGRPKLSLEQVRRNAAEDADFILPERPAEHDNRIGFTRNFSKGLYSSRTILFCALQIAYHLGYRKIFILGMDLNYQGSSARFYESKTQMRPSRIERDFEPYIIPAFELVKKIGEREPFQVYNLSSASRLPETILPRLTFQDALAMVRADD